MTFVPPNINYIWPDPLTALTLIPQIVSVRARNDVNESSDGERVERWANLSREFLSSSYHFYCISIVFINIFVPRTAPDPPTIDIDS